MEPYDFKTVNISNNEGEIISEWTVPNEINVNEFINKIILKERLT